VTELGIILEEFGRALIPGPFFSSAALGGPAIAIGGKKALKEAWLPRVASGEARVTLALLEESAQLAPVGVQCKAEKSGDGFKLTGKKYFVPDVASAHAVVVAARTKGGKDGTTLFLVETNAPGVSVEANKLTDSTSRSGQLVLNGVEVGAGAVIGKIGGGWETVDQVLMIGNVGLAADCIAGAEKIFWMTINYAKERKQFGRPIGSFQAVKHPLADLYGEIESARSAYHYAAWAVDASNPDARSAVAVARLTCAEAYRSTTLKCLQAHGGIGFTWEYDLHLYLKRAKHNQYFLGVESDYESIVAAEALGI
jgi:alkylation response protein AidB-like acyl-CoA dehydrogenase